jgi:hypothetical protein
VINFYFTVLGKSLSQRTTLKSELLPDCFSKRLHWKNEFLREMGLGCLGPEDTGPCRMNTNPKSWQNIWMKFLGCRKRTWKGHRAPDRILSKDRVVEGMKQQLYYKWPCCLPQWDSYGTRQRKWLQRLAAASSFLFFLDRTGVWTQGCALTRQALCSLSHTSSPFCSGCFEEEDFLNYLPELASNWNPPYLSLPISKD